jgi:hypothetical protein
VHKFVTWTELPLFSPLVFFDQFAFVPHTDCSTYRAVELNKIGYIYMYILTLISRTVPVSVYNTVYEPIQQSRTVQYKSWLRWTAMNLLPQRSVTHLYFSDIHRPFRSQVQFVCCGCFLRAFSWVCWRRLRNRIIWYLSSWVRLILSCYENGLNNPTNA